jgi:predicted dehydrogenase
MSNEQQVVRWGLIGCGDIAAKRVAAALRDVPGSRLDAVSRRQAEKAEEFAGRFGARRWHASWEELIASEVDAIYIATPVDLHARMAIAAAQAGKHVLCEKPMALDVGECDRMVAAADASGVKLGVAYYRHFYPIVQRLKALLKEGAIGAPVTAQADCFGEFDPGPDDPRRWIVDKGQSGGGPMFDVGCHRLEVFTNLFGAVAEVRGVVARVALSRNVEDTGVAVLRFEGGPVATVRVSHAIGEARDSLEVYGRTGSVHIPSLNGSLMRIRAAGIETVEHHAPPANLHQPLVEQFVRAVRSQEAPSVDGKAGREVNRLLAEVVAEKA